METIKKYFIGLLIAALVLGGVIGFLINRSSEGVFPFGAANPSSTVISYYAALNKQVLWDVLNSMMMDITAARAPLGGIATTTASINWGVLNNTDSASSSVVNVAGGGTVGDLVLVIPTTATTTDFVSFKGEITTSGTTNASATIYATVASSTGISASLGTLNMGVYVLPASSFKAAASIRTSTTTKY